MAQTPFPVGGLILAAGAGRRMGGPKALVRPRPDGPTLLEHTITVLRRAGIEDITTVLGAEATHVLPYAASAGARVILADDWAQGMGASLRAGLSALAARPCGATGFDAVLVTLVDLPDVTPEVIRRVLAQTRAVHGARAAEAADAAAVHNGEWATAVARAAYEGKPGHPVVLGRATWPDVVATATGDRGARDFLRAADPVLIECGDLASGADVDTPADLARRRAGDG
ncbi:nucleotidyltransferase family protein [Nostocoides jenkinsii]|uniref:MobA-like NTP transferase domain-containing protein n=1 Tax=Nostocoides jenkinsii Ben 74 TaxID=1193518 RepID=A0A077MFI8_9MICO|nr:nucleotidyltransferase family protein [Tetrasphaera jenkinsii]CCI54880.1 conserved hypothetical protein [Tetrasphaera jenkinsii Ben 74]